MATHDDPRKQYRRNLRDMRACEDVADADKEAIAEYLDAVDPETFGHSLTDEEGRRVTHSVGTLHTYTHGLKRIAEMVSTPLIEIESADIINQLMNDLSTGSHSHHSAKDGGYASGTLKGWQSALTGFYRYHDHIGVDPDAIVVAEQKRSTVDDRDMYSREEVEALRDACDNPRDRCLLELLLNTGQRIRAIQTLRIKDVDHEEGVYYLNDSVDGLKRADSNGTKRPLLGARRAVYEWLQYHPASDDPDGALITKQPKHNRGVAGESIAQSTIRRALRKIANEAGVDKPPNPQNFRHYFVTICKRDYGMADDTIKHLIGHSETSTVMNTTYKHLTDDDHIREAEIKAGIRDADEEDSPLTPVVCPTCMTTLEPNAKACGGCGEVFAPNAKAIEAELPAVHSDPARASVDVSIADDVEAKLERLEELEARLDRLEDTPKPDADVPSADTRDDG